jgi:glutathione S-transferase
MPVTITVFENSPDRGRGLARDMPVRWALEEAGLPYDTRPVSMAALKEPGHRALNPFGQIPALQEDGLVLFESGAIVLHIAEGHPGLLPADPDARARAVTWIFAALSTVEPPVIEYSTAMLFERGESWHEQRLPLVLNRLRTRLDDLSARLGSADWLEEDGFTAGDLMMVSVLRRLKGHGVLESYPNLQAHVARGEARPAFRRAFAAQLELFTRNQAG